MKALNARSTGFSPVLIIVIVAVVGLIGYLGYTFYTNSQQQTETTGTEQSAVAEDVQKAPTVNSTSDLDDAAAALDQADTTSSRDSAELDSQLSTF